MDFLGAIMGWGQVQNNMVCLGKVPMPLPLCLLPKNIHTTSSVLLLAPYMFICSIDFDFFFWKGEQEKTKSGRFFLKQMEGYVYFCGFCTERCHI